MTGIAGVIRRRFGRLLKKVEGITPQEFRLLSIPEQE